MPERVDLIMDENHERGATPQSQLILIDDDITHVTIVVDRSTLPEITDREVCTAIMWIQYGTGPFVASGGVGYVGGDHVSRRGQLVPYTTTSRKLLPGTNRKIFVRYDVKEPHRVKCDCDQKIRG